MQNPWGLSLSYSRHRSCTNVDDNALIKMSKLTDKLIMDFKSGHIRKTDLIVILAHPTIGLLIWYAYQQDLIDKESLKDFTGGYLFLLPPLLVGLFFRNLRNIKFYLAWLTISIIQVFIYPLVKDNPDFTFPRGHHLTD